MQHSRFCEILNMKNSRVCPNSKIYGRNLRHVRHFNQRSETTCTVLSTVVQNVQRRDRVRSHALLETLRSRATNSQARRFVIAIYDCGPRSSPSLSATPSSSSFPAGRALNGVLNNGFIYGAWNTRRDARDMRRTCLRRRKYKLHRATVMLRSSRHRKKSFFGRIRKKWKTAP